MKQQSRLIRPLAVSMFVALVAATALPLARVWRQNDALPEALNIGTQGASLYELAIDLRDDVSASDVAQIEAQTGLKLVPNSIESRESKTFHATLSAQSDGEKILQTLRADARVEVAEPETDVALPDDPKVASKYFLPVSRATQKAGWVPNDPRFEEQWNMEMVGAPRAWTRSHGRGIVVAVIDTGVALRESGGGPLCRDFAQTKGVPGYNFVDDNDDAYDDLGHGTHVAGTIAESTNNGEGVAGLAFEASIMPLKVFGAKGWGSSLDLADAIRFAADHGANVINMSLGTSIASGVIYSAVKYARRKGVLIVCSAGNSGGGPVGFPAAFRHCVAVSSVGPSGKLAFYSSIGPQVALAAPGGDTRGADGGFDESGGILQNAYWPTDQGGRGDDYYFFQGTSMAAPHVAAAAALVMAQGIGDTERVRDILLRSSVASGARERFGAGILSADGATSMAARQISNARIFWGMLAFIGALIFLGAPRDLAGQKRLALAALFVAGALIPFLASKYFGANGIWNLLTFSALLPFLLFWEWEVGWKSTLAGNFAAGSALFLAASLSFDGLSPLMHSTFGGGEWLWTIANLGAASMLAMMAWKRARLR
jgi:serine protease